MSGRKSIPEQMAIINDEIAKSKMRIKKDTERISSLRRELETLENLEIKSLISELEMPMEELKKFLKVLKKSPAMGLIKEQEAPEL